MTAFRQSNRDYGFAIPLGAIRLKDSSHVGGKAAHLGELMAAGFPVPGGFVVTTDACREFLESDQQVRNRLEKLEVLFQDLAAQRRVSEELRQTLEAIPVPGDVADAVRTRLAGTSVSAWAVRSSATHEDSEEASFAGQYDSFLDVRGCDAVVAAVKRCWLSLFSDRAVSYRIRKGVAAGQPQLAVIVQQWIEADVAGVMFTGNPANGGRDCIVIEAAFGPGQNVVQGRNRPDRITVSRSNLRVSRHEGGLKMTQVADKGVRDESIPPVLADETAVELARLGLKVERLFKMPQDIEWALCGGRLFLLQARPVTSKLPFETWDDRQVWSNFNTGEVMPDVMAPMTWSLWQSLTQGAGFRSIFRLLGADLRRAPLVGLVAGRLYFNVNTAMAAFKPFPFNLNKAMTLFQAIGGGQAEAYRQTLSIPAEALPDLGFRWPKYILSWPRIFFDLITHLPGSGETWLARFNARTDQLVGTKIESMSKPELIRFCARLLREIFKDVDLLYLAVPAALMPLLQKAVRDWLGDPHRVLGYRLFSALGGIPTAEAGLALWRLAALAHADSNTENAVCCENEWAQVRATLQFTGHGRKWLAAWNAFMIEHGHHCRGELELFNPRWSETPDYILRIVRGYLRSMDQSDPLENQRKLIVERQQLTERWRRQLRNPLKRWCFCWSLRHVQRLVVFREQLKNQAVRRFSLIRRVLLVLGRRLQEEGILYRHDDLFFLEMSELEPVAMDNGLVNWRERIAHRRNEFERNLKIFPPGIVTGRLDAVASAPPVFSRHSKLLEGTPVSPGVVVGHARVILHVDDHEQVRPGEILIAPFTDPAWSPYFLTAAGLVVEQGGILSHGSIIAREYGLPAVTNVDSATRSIRTGDVVQVDGNNGRVTILPHEFDCSSKQAPSPQRTKQ